MPKITKKKVDNTTPTDEDLSVWDRQIAGFGLTIHPTGKSYVFQYCTPEGRIRRATIGKHSETLTTDLARKRDRERRRCEGSLISR